MKRPLSILWPLGSLLVGTLVALLGGRAPSAEPLASPDSLMPQPSEVSRSGVGLDSASSPADSPVQGEVLEVIAVPKYVYLRLKEPSGQELWAAVLAQPVRVGEQIRIDDAQAIQDFSSSTLERTFELIYFGNLARTAQSPPRDAETAPDQAGGNDRAAPSKGTAPVEAIDRAPGRLGRTIAELFRERQALDQKRVQVRGRVVKVVPGVLGKTFIHIRDGSGSASSGDHDLTVTTQLEPEVGQILLLDGVANRDVDLGAGYVYPVLLTDATLVTE